MEVLEVWPGSVPGDYGEIGEETFRPPPSKDAKGVRWLTNVTHPTITVYRPAPDLNTGTAMVICPGGGYWDLCWDVEGEEVAEWLSSIGITGVILKYRVPRRPGQPEKLPAPGPLSDAQRAISLVRSIAPEWSIDPQRIGIIGFSAGGHLAIAAATHFDRRTYDPVDDADSASCRPDFAVALYSGYLVVDGTEMLAPHIRIPPGAPPIFLAHATDDAISDSANSAVMYLALKRTGIPAELHVFSAGGHGFGVPNSTHPGPPWPELCVRWLSSLGLFRPTDDVVPRSERASLRDSVRSEELPTACQMLQ